MSLTHTVYSAVKKVFGGMPDRVKIGKRYVGPEEPVFVIAEIGINHNGDMSLAKQLVDAAKDAGADAVKFQKRTTTEILTKEGRDKPYTSPHAYAATYGEHRDKLEFSEEQYHDLKKYCAEKGILFFASVWDTVSTDFMDRLGTDAYKIPSADMINIPLIEYVAQKDRPILLSTGMNTLEEIDAAVQAALKHNNRVIIFHCLSLYPAPEEKLNMRFMNVLKERFAPLPFGYSGHERDELPTLAAVALGAQIIERHFTLDKTMKGSDHAGSLEPEEFKNMVGKIRRIEKTLGVPEKVLYEELIPLRDKLAKSVAARAAIPEGVKITREMLCIKGPGTGILPRDLEKIIGRTAKAAVAEDSLIPKEAITW
ncbi:N-acylneuraminate-9-phosphate synthase [Candidatus Kaiserbacteria bacterium]|nr:N-acylneuraminate-9-phosphate synthase [Candidatus Kaiserbacteria bacterium]